MGDMLSQDEINALLGSSDDIDDKSGGPAVPESEPFGINAQVEGVSEDSGLDSKLTGVQKDCLGEIGNIGMGTAATTLFALLGQRVLITTPKVTVKTWADLSKSYTRPCVGIRVDYKEGLQGFNVLVLKEHDVRIISNLMVGGNGIVPEDGELTEIDLSAIGEAMNQMVGSASTSLSSMMKMKIDIDVPKAVVLDFNKEDFLETLGFENNEVIACILFRMEIGTLIDSEIIQVLPVEFAIDMVETLQAGLKGPAESPRLTPPHTAPAPVASPAAAAPVPHYEPPKRPLVSTNVDVQPAKFQDFNLNELTQQKENISIIMDVPLEVTVELGRTKRKIRDILEFSAGTIVELDKLAGEPIDILVNGKFVAKGEVVVIDENFGIRITDIISAEHRI
ncbi:MAG: flagellar motor switch phosphatase FliY [Clostridiales bacterium]|jgi:flagellar motor switch protein FliN/FliY|nr:flagellar motor switch phosphatase FliY [Clostridiales bacterium]